LPVVIRLIDPPLHEFLPSLEELLVEITELRVRGNDPAELKRKEELLEQVQAMHEQNPMLGLRGIRLGITFPAISEMQARAITTAMCELVKEGVDARPEIMLPLVGHVNEMQRVREQLEKVVQEVQAHYGTNVHVKIGTMIEVPRAALTAGQIAEVADFFSFGTNDLTQMTLAFSRDDAEGGFLTQYLDDGVLERNPFQTLDQSGVGTLIEFAVRKAREVSEGIKLGICGEHGGDPDSIAFCDRTGLDYVSCSPFRVPIARLAAAQAALRRREPAA
jgi:pyruvate,orthophosphate dikinase